MLKITTILGLTVIGLTVTAHTQLSSPDGTPDIIGLETEIGTDQVKPIEPPFALQWGETPENIQAWANANGFPMTSGKTKDKRDAIEIEGPFPNAEFDRLRFYFSTGQLTEVELQFIKTGPEEDGIEFSAITQAMAVKHSVDGRLGKGQLIKNEKGKDGKSNWQFIQQIWTDEEHSVWLAIFTATEQHKGCLSLTSLHYRWEKKLDRKKNPSQ